MKSPLVFVCVFLLLAPTSAAQAISQESVGEAIVVVNLVTAAFNRDTRSLQSGDNVHQNELIEVGSDASSELELNDDTKLALGPGSRLTLDKFVYDPAKSKGSIVLDLVKGTFRFMTGVAEKPTYVINTPAAAITVRGTIFDVFVETSGRSWLLLHEGAVEICNKRNTCRDHTEPGKLIRIGDDGDLGTPTRWASLQGKDDLDFDDAFPFVAKPPGIDPSPIFTRAAILRGMIPDGAPQKEETYEKPKRAETETYEEQPRKKVESYEKPTKRKKATKSASAYENYNKRKKYKQARDNSAAKKAAGILATGAILAIGAAALSRGRGGGHYKKY